jgi:hypothetical protein
MQCIAPHGCHPDAVAPRGFAKPAAARASPSTAVPLQSLEPARVVTTPSRSRRTVRAPADVRGSATGSWHDGLNWVHVVKGLLGIAVRPDLEKEQCRTSLTPVQEDEAALGVSRDAAELTKHGVRCGGVSGWRRLVGQRYPGASIHIHKQT